MTQNLEEVKKQYEYLFKNIGKNEDGLVNANDAVELFKKSGLDSDSLKNVCYICNCILNKVN